MSIVPVLANAAEITTYREEGKDYIMVRFYFKVSGQEKSRIPIEWIPVATLVLTRSAYKQIIKKFQGFLAQQEEHKT